MRKEGGECETRQERINYSLEIVDVVWIAPQLEIHPIEKQWMAAQTNTGFEQLDNLMDSWNEQPPAMILKQDSVIRLKDLLKEKESAKTEKIEITAIEKLDPSKLSWWILSLLYEVIQSLTQRLLSFILGLIRSNTTGLSTGVLRVTTRSDCLLRVDFFRMNFLGDCSSDERTDDSN